MLNVTRVDAAAAAAAYVSLLVDNGTVWRGYAIDLLPTRVIFRLSEEDQDELENDRASGEETHSPRSALAFFSDVTWSREDYYVARRALYRDLCEECVFVSEKAKVSEKFSVRFAGGAPTSRSTRSYPRASAVIAREKIHNYYATK